MKCVDGHAVPEGFYFCPECSASVRCPNGHARVQGALSCPDCGQAYPRPLISAGGPTGDLKRPSLSPDDAPPPPSRAAQKVPVTTTPPISPPASPPQPPLGWHEPPVVTPKKNHTIRNGLVIFGALAVLVGIIVVAAGGGGSSGPSESALEANLLAQVQCTNAPYCLDEPDASYVDCSDKSAPTGLPYDPGGSYSISWKPGAYILCNVFDDNSVEFASTGLSVEQGVPASKAHFLMGDPPNKPGGQYRYTDWIGFEGNSSVLSPACFCDTPSGPYNGVTTPAASSFLPGATTTTAPCMASAALCQDLGYSTSTPATTVPAATTVTGYSNPTTYLGG